MEYPPRCIKGIPNDDCITEGGHVVSHLFYFKENADRIKDKWLESSINWEDDKDAIQFTLDQEKNGNLQFKFGVATILTSSLEHIKTRPLLREKFNFERQVLAGNPYHGNLLAAKLAKRDQRQLAAMIALHVDEIVPRSI